MSNQFLKLRRSAVPGRVPSTSSIDFGEIALNTFDGLAFIKRSGSNGEEVITLGSREGAFTGSFSGSFVGNGAGLFNVPASGIVGLNLSQIATGSVSASVGIGAASFNVVSASNSLLYVSSSGNVGIGTNAPAYKLTVTGSGTVAAFYGNGSATAAIQVGGGELGTLFIENQTNGGGAGINIYTQRGNTSFNIGYRTTSGANGGPINIGNLTSYAAGNINFLQNGATKVIIDTSGNVGIGTITPSASLHISGSQATVSTIARGSIISTALVASANNDILIGLDINPAFTNGAFTGVSNYTIRATGQVLIGRSGGGDTEGFSMQYVADNTLGGTYQSKFVSLAPGVAYRDLAFLSRAALFQIDGYRNALYISNNANTILNSLTDSGERLQVSGSSRFIGNMVITGSLTVTDTLTVQRIVAQTITSSTDYVSGSTIFGNSLSNTHQFTGSVSITGSLSLPYLSTGSVLFVGSGGSISQNNSNFFWDNINGNLGVGTNSVNSAFKLGVNGNIVISGTSPYITFNTATNSGTTPAYIQYVNSTSLLNILSSGAIDFYSNANNRMRLFGSTGNLSIGGGTSPTDSGNRLQVYGTTFLSGSVTGSDMLIRGSGNSSSTNAFQAKNSSGTNLFTVVNDGYVYSGYITYVGQSSTNPLTFAFDGSAFTTPNTAGRNYGYFNSNTNQTGDQYHFGLSGNSLSPASGNHVGLYYARTFAPTSGNATYSALQFSQTINQTGGANGITRGLYVNPTLTAGADFRAIEWSNNISGSTSWGLYGAGTAPNFLSGSLSIGTTATGSKLTIGGTETAVSAIARGQLINTALTASANLDALIGLDIAPTFASGGFATITNIGIRSTVGGGTNQTPTWAAQFINNTNAFGNHGVLIQNSQTSDNSFALLVQAGGANNTFTIKGNRYLWYNGGNAYFGNFANAAARVHIRGGASEPSLIVEDSFATSSFQVQANRNVLIGSTSDSGHRLQVSGNTFISGTLDILDAEINYQRNNNVTTGSARLIASIPTASLNAAFFDYVIVSGSNARAGTVTSVWASSSVEWNETYTNDIGSTTDVSLYAAITGSSIGLFATSSINNIWTIKSLIRTI